MKSYVGWQHAKRIAEEYRALGYRAWWTHDGWVEVR